MKLTNRYSVLTKNGFKKFSGVKKSEHSESLVITFTDNSNIECSINHLFNIKNDVFVEANELKVNDYIEDKQILKIEKKHENVELFDLVDVEDGNHYITSGVTSHNCAFIRGSIWDEFSDSIFPSQSGLAWKKNIIISTANGMNHFYHIVEGAKDGTSGRDFFEVDWRDVPRYKKDGSQYTPEEFMESIISKHGIVYFNQNYANEFLGSSHTLISADKLKMMKKAELEMVSNGLKIYEFPKKESKYIIAVDPAKDGKDAFAVQIVDISKFPFKQVASANLQIDYLLMPEFLDEWGRMYNMALIIIENNEGAGQSIADQLAQDYEYENLWYDKEGRNKKKKRYPGFRTTSRTRGQILKTLKLFIENDNLIILDEETIKQFFTFIHVNNKYQADDNAHDDLIMSLAIIFAPFTDTKNFEDMNQLIKGMYSEEAEVDFTDYLTIGNFDDYSDEDFNQLTNHESNW